MIYKVYFPDGKIACYKVKYKYIRLPALGKVFYTTRTDYSAGGYNLVYYEIVEIGENELWVEEITPDVYSQTIGYRDLNFAHFEYVLMSGMLKEYNDI